MPNRGTKEKKSYCDIKRGVKEMQLFDAEITEIRSKKITIPAESREDAGSIAHDMYLNSQIELSKGDFNSYGVSISPRNITLSKIVNGYIRFNNNSDEWVNCSVNLETKEVFGFNAPDKLNGYTFTLWLYDAFFDVWGEDMVESGDFWTKLNVIEKKKETKKAEQSNNDSPSHGHWCITRPGYYDCSVCGKYYKNGCVTLKEAAKNLQSRKYIYSYCPFCGSVMDEDVI